ncbi:dynein regulatory complex protein 1 isoform X1 [Calliopsis andreniformis]|uniref:dynein regulatory complex protein 1 isoform X1 n=1 Tax=Calliopsis andreniformis TaxID=337506 RepID=UPI003FCC559D
MTTIFERYSDVSTDEDEPSVLSADPTERKLARRLRIKKRLEAQIRQAKTEDEQVEEISLTEQQILDSIDALEKLSAEGDEVITGVRIANDARELQRRKEVQETRERLLQILEEEDEKCMEKYQEITEKWPSILASKDPLDIHNRLDAQNAECLEILEKKDALIAELKLALENADLQFAEDMKKQNEDIDLIIERMENQVRSMTKAYRHELELIETVIESERKLLLTNSMERWEALFNMVKDDTLEGREKRKEIMQEYEIEMKKAMIEHQEKFREQKITLELEIEQLQQEVQSMKVLCLMNVEKLDYNYAVLKRREEENLIVKNQQKRRINKLQDVVNDLKKTYSDLQESTKQEIQKVTNQILKTHKAILDLEDKSNHLANINDRKYMQIWDMNIETANKLVDKILAADRIIHEQLLGVEWQPPTEKLLKKEDLPSYCGALCTFKQKKEEEKRRKMISKSYKPATTLEDINLERRLLNHIAKLLSDHCDYFIENTLKELLSTYTEDDNLLIRLDKVFEAIKITSETEFQFLLNFFLPYAHCPTCTVKTVSTPSVCGQTSETTESSSITDLPEVCGSDDFNTEEAKLISAMEEAFCCEKFNDDNVGDEEEEAACSEEASLSESPSAEMQIATTCVQEGIVEITDVEGEPKRLLTCDKGHLLVIETEFVANALKEFVERYQFVKREKTPSTVGTRVLTEKSTVSRNITEQDMITFWEKYRNIFSKDKETLWDHLLVGLKKYHDVLKERHQLNSETESLRKQNAELRRLLRNYSEEPQEMELTDEEANLVQSILQN